MRDHDRPRADFRALLERVEAASPTAAIEVVAEELAALVGARAVSFLIADFSGRALVRFGTPAHGIPGPRRQGPEQAQTVPLAGTVYERVLRTQQVDVHELADGAHLIVPVTDRGDAVGVIELILPSYPDDQVVADVAATAHALAYVVIANRRHTDLFEWGQRTTPFSLAAEIQRRLLPGSYTCETDRFTLAGWLEPANAVGGDTFDYNLDRETLHMSITDAVGHEVEAALLATLLVGSLRNGRRRGLNLRDQADTANDALAAHTHAGEFVTDGMLERNAAQLDVAATLRQTRDLHAREVVHALGAAVLRAAGNDLRDDATVVVLDWYGGPLRRRESTHGASQQYASP